MKCSVDCFSSLSEVHLRDHTGGSYLVAGCKKGITYVLETDMAGMEGFFVDNARTAANLKTVSFVP